MTRSLAGYIASLILVAGCARQQSAHTAVTRTVTQGLIDVPGARLYYETFGRGDPIVVVHGGPGMDHNYLLPGMKGLAQTHRVIFYDQRGVGRTEGVVDSTTVSFDRFLTDIDAIGDSLRLGRFVLLGHSFGGLVAMRYAARHPERLRALVIMNTSEPGQRYAAQSRPIMRRKQTPEDSAEFRRIVQSDAFKQRDSSAVNAMLRTFFRASFADPSLASQLDIHEDQRTSHNMMPVATLVMGPLGPNFDLWPEVATIRVPTLIVHGAEDLVPLEMPRELAQKIPGAQLVVIERAGHFPYVEKPAETFAAINQFLSRVP
jgi:proline iminopeptidase